MCGKTSGSCTSVPLDLGGAADQLFLSLYGTGIGKVALSDLFVHVGNNKAD